MGVCTVHRCLVKKQKSHITLSLMTSITNSWERSCCYGRRTISLNNILMEINRQEKSEHLKKIVCLFRSN